MAATPLPFTGERYNLEMEGITGEFQELFHNSSFRVNDLNIGSETRFVFILESPHTAEVKYGVPVAGASGKSMTVNLFGRRFGAAKPLGLLIGASQKGDQTEGIPLDMLRRIGIMNVSPVPLQRAFYKRSGSDEFSAVTGLLDRIRIGGRIGGHRNSDMNYIEGMILDDFRKRLAAARRLNIALYIVCGHFAQMYFNVADGEGGISPDKVIHMPHPAYNSWSRSGMNNRLAELRNVIIGNTGKNALN